MRNGILLPGGHEAEISAPRTIRTMPVSNWDRILFDPRTEILGFRFIPSSPKIVISEPKTQLQGMPLNIEFTVDQMFSFSTSLDHNEMNGTFIASSFYENDIALLFAREIR